jgi:hypothetical protein
MGKSDMDVMAQAQAADLLEPASDPVWSALLAAPRPARSAPLPEVVVGELLALADGGCAALVRYAGQPGTAALVARSLVDLHGAHVGRSVALGFEGGDAGRPIVTGVLREPGRWPLAETPAQVQVDVDGERMQVSARQELVLRCGKASITLTKAGKVLIQGNYVSSRSTGVNRIKGGSVQLN